LAGKGGDHDEEGMRGRHHDWVFSEQCQTGNKVKYEVPVLVREEGDKRETLLFWERLTVI